MITNGLPVTRIERDDKVWYDFSSNGELEVLNPLIDGSSMKQENIWIFINFLYESDTLQLEDQIYLLSKKKNIINRAVFSGNKSIHCRVSIHNPPSYKDTQKNIDAYKYIWKLIRDEHFKDIEVDYQCSNPNRLTRRPNMIRTDNGVLQKLLYKSDNQITIDWQDRFEMFNVINSQVRQMDIDLYSNKLKGKVKNEYGLALLNHEDINGQNLFIAIASLHGAGYSKETVKEIGGYIRDKRGNNNVLKKYQFDYALKKIYGEEQ